MMFRHSCYAMLLFLTCSSAAMADLIVTVGDLTLTGGNSGYIPVTISGSGELVGVTEFELQITPVGSAPLNLEFASSPSPASDPTFSDSSYIFSGQSSDLTTPSPLGFTLGAPNDTFYGLDLANNNNVSVTGAMLLADVPVTTLGPPGATSDSYLISLVSGGTAFSDGTQTNFYNFTGVSGNVTVDQPSLSTVPEPSTFGMMLAGMAGMFWRKRRRKVAQRTTDN